MFLVCSFENSKRQKEEANTESEAMDGAQGCVLSPRPSLFGLDHGSIQTSWYLLAYILLARNGLLKEVWETIFEKEMYMSSLEHMGFKKRRTMTKTRPGGNHNGNESNGCFVPGLCDDVALDSLARICRSDYPKLAGLNRRFRSLIDSGYLYTLRRQLGIIEQWVYLACSLMPWEAFDPVRQRWMRLPRMPCDDCFSCADKESLAVGTELLVFGQELSGFAIWMYSLVRRDWSRCPLMNLPRCLFGSSSCGEIAIIAGGSDRNGRVLKSTELYNSEMCCWESLPDMNLPRKLCSGFFMDGKFYVIGGMSSQTDPLTCGEEYDLERRTWKRIEDMYPRGNRATQSPPLVAVVNNQLYAADESTNEVKKYDKTDNTWRVVRALPVRADSYNGWGLAFKACGDKLLVVGGHRGPEGEVIVLHSWCPEDGRESDWNVLSVRERAGAFVYNCAVMGC